MARDDIQDIPSFAASRDEALAAAPRGAPPSARPRTSNGGGNGGDTGGGLGGLGKLVLTVAFLGAVGACGGGWFLYQELVATQQQLAQTTERVGNLELLLSDTDESLNQSSAKINEDLGFWKTEIRKLWDWRNKEAKPALDKLEKEMGSANTSIKRLRTVADNNATAVKGLEADLVALKKLSGDLERMAASAKRAQTDMERLADGVNKARLERAAIGKRVGSNEEWIESINAFRRQINSKISSLEAQIRAANTAPATTPLQ